jgi:uncharacterized membrane protein YgcG
MSSDSTDSTFGANKNPRHFMVLDAIARGIKDVDKISRTTKHSKKQELEQQAEQLRQWQRNGNTAQLQSYMESDTNRSWMPFMLFSGIMNVLFFTSMMSMMGMALNPMEGQMTGESGAGSEGAGESAIAETDSSSSSGTEGGDVVDTGGADFGGFDGGDFGDF